MDWSGREISPDVPFHRGETLLRERCHAGELDTGSTSVGAAAVSPAAVRKQCGCLLTDSLRKLVRRGNIRKARRKMNVT